MRKGIFQLTWFWLTFYSGISILLSEPVDAQKIFYEELTTAEGLPSDYVNTVFEDSKGFLWIGTDKGACCYKGRQFLYLNKDNGLTSNFINCITEDPQGNIWFGTFEGGLCKYDGQKIVTAPLKNGITFRNVFDIVFNKDGSFFLEADNFNLYFFQHENASPQKILTKGPSFISSIGNDRFLVSSSNNAIYFLEKNGYRLSLHEIWHTKMKGEMVLTKPHHGRFVALERNGISVYETKGQNVLLYKKITLPGNLPEGHEKTFYSNGKEIWVSAYNGLLYVDKDDQPHFFAVEKELGGNYVNNIYEDRAKNIYLCTFGGGIKIWPRFYLQEFPIQGKVTSIFPFSGAIHLTTTKEVYKYTPGKKVEVFKNLNFDNFSTFYESEKGIVFLGTYKSFLKLPREQLLYDLNSRTRKKYETFTDIGISGFLQKGDDGLFVSMYGGGLYVFDRKNRIVDSFTTKNQRIGSGMVEFLKPLKNSIAALTFGSGLTLIDSNGHSTIIGKRDGLLSNSVYSVYQDKGNQIWIGTLNGVSLYDGKKIIRTFSFDDGFLGSKVLCIFRDQQMRLWVLSDKYLHLVEKNRLRAIRSQPVLFDSKNSINRAAYDTATSNLYLGLTDALLIVDISKIFPDTLVRAPGLAAFIAGDSSLLWKEKNIPVAAGINKIVFQFTNQHFSITQKSDIYYRLAGFTDEWKLLDNSAELTYAKLPSGKYELLAKSINPDGYAYPEISLIRFEILPPFWRRSWFLLLSSAVLLSLVFYMGKKYSRRQYEKKIRQMEEVYQLQLERERIARELHDNVGSQLTYLINKIEDEHSLLADKSEAEKLSNFARGTMRELRETIWALDKKEVLPEELEIKIRQLLQLYKDDRCTIELEWQYNKFAQKRLESPEALNIYRIVQEALNNAVKYSCASLIRVGVHYTGSGLSILIEDNGKGFEMAEIEKGYGFQNMEKRAQEMKGELKIKSRPGEGTRVELWIK